MYIPVEARAVQHTIQLTGAPDVESRFLASRQGVHAVGLAFTARASDGIVAAHQPEGLAPGAWRLLQRDGLADAGHCATERWTSVVRTSSREGVAAVLYVRVVWCSRMALLRATPVAGASKGCLAKRVRMHKH